MNPCKKSIGWADYTWNPVTGCKRECPYCYAKKNWNRFHRKRIGCDFDEIKFYQERLYDQKLGDGKTIFVGSMSDIEYWDKNWTEIIINTVKHYPYDTFMFLSKNPESYSGFNWPINTMQGLTVVANDPENICKISQLPRPFLSIEPLLGNFIRIPMVNLFETVIVGAMTGPGAIKPEPEWIKSVKDNVPADKIFWKNNIKKYL